MKGAKNTAVKPEKVPPLKFPLCLNKNDAKMVCLFQKCQDYPFFCSNCEDSSCQIVHQHDDKLISVSFKEFTRRVLKQRKPIVSLSDAMTSYREVLEKLKQDVNQFIEKEIVQLDQIEQKTQEIPEEDQQLILKLKGGQYEGLTGIEMDQLWKSCAEDPEKVQSQEQTAEFIKIKEEEVKGISQHFQHLNNLDYTNLDQQQETPKSKAFLSKK